MLILNEWEKALQFIEDNLRGRLDLKEVARKANSSEYHFQRMFTCLSGVNLSEYIRRRQMTMAAIELIQTDIKVLDLALDYGYSTPEAFTRAFRSVHNQSPSQVRRHQSFKVFPKLTFHLTLKGEKDMNVKVEKKAPFAMYGVERVFSLKNGENYKKIPLFWDEFYASEWADKLPTTETEDHHAVMDYEKLEDEQMPYMICSRKKESSDTTGFKEVVVPAAEWAIFTTEVVELSRLTEVVQDLWHRIFSEWFPISGYEHAPLPECEFYYKQGKDREYAEIWIPVMK